MMGEEDPWARLRWEAVMCPGWAGAREGGATHLPGELFMPPPRSSRELRDRRLVAANKGAVGSGRGGGGRRGKGESLRYARLDLGTCGSLLTVSDRTDCVVTERILVRSMIGTVRGLVRCMTH